jgi:hypothetical protein
MMLFPEKLQAARVHLLTRAPLPCLRALQPRACRARGAGDARGGPVVAALL